jgi:acetyl-CoA synthetase
MRYGSQCKTLKHIIVVGDEQPGDLCFQRLMNEASSHLDIVPTKSTDIAFLCYTSGTTGNPKGAVHLHRWVPGNDPSVLFWQNAKKTDLLAHTGDLNWIYPLGNGFLYPWRFGISTFIYDGKFDPVRWFELLEKYQVTNLASVPTAYRMFLTVKKAEETYNLSSLRHCISAGEPLNPEVIKEWKRRFGLDIYDGIGMTEIMVYLSNMRDMKMKLGSCGKPQPGHICALLMRRELLCPLVRIGVLAVEKTDPGLFKEYWGKPDKTKESFTGSLVSLR